MRAMESNKIREVSEGHETPASMPQFDMKEAVEVSLFHRTDIINQIHNYQNDNQRSHLKTE